MEKKIASGIMLTLLAISMLALTVSAEQNKRMGEVVYSVPSPTAGYTSGLEWDGTALWVSGGFDGMIYRFDPFTNTIVTSFPGPTGYLRDLAWDGANLWVTSWDWPRNIYKLNPIYGSVITSFSAPFSGHPDGLAWDGDCLWIGEEDGKIYKVDPSNGQVIYSFSVDFEFLSHNPRGLAWDGEHIWAGYQSVGLIKKHDISTGNVLAEFTSPSGMYQQGLAWDGEYLWSTGGDNYIYRINVIESISANVQVDPDTLNLRSRGQWITAYIELPISYNVEDINVSSILLNETVPAELKPTAIGDFDYDAIPDLMVKFDRDQVISYILDHENLKELVQTRFMTVTLAMTGKLNDGTLFQGSDTVKVVLPPGTFKI